MSAKLRAYQGIGATLHCTLRALRRSTFGSLTRELANGYLHDWSKRLLEIAKTSPKVAGQEQLELGKPYIFMSNHRSLYDIPAVVVGVWPHPVRLIAKADLFKVPLWGKAMWDAEIIKLDRRNREQAIRDLQVAGEKLKTGLCMWIAPEGGRSRDGKLRDYKKGGFMMALQTGVPIVPIGLAGTEAISPVDRLECYQGAPTATAIGQPIPIQPYLDKHQGDTTKARDELMADVRRAMITLVEQAEDMLPA
jgi:1-acyl-sn-glycerol-3-phosphate acyltransferase